MVGGHVWEGRGPAGRCAQRLPLLPGKGGKGRAGPSWTRPPCRPRWPHTGPFGGVGRQSQASALPAGGRPRSPPQWGTAPFQATMAASPRLPPGVSAALQPGRAPTAPCALRSPELRKCLTFHSFSNKYMVEFSRKYLTCPQLSQEALRGPRSRRGEPTSPAAALS